MVGSITPSEEAQLTQTIEMFEVITQSQPQDYQSLEILKEAYVKLGREEEALNTSKRIAHAYVLLGQLSSAILEFESILQRYPDDPDVLAALGEIERKANTLSTQPGLGEVPQVARRGQTSFHAKTSARKSVPTDYDDGRESMRKIFVETKYLSQAHFDECWVKPDLAVPPDGPVEPFVAMLAEKKFMTVEKALRLISEKSRCGFFPLEKYDIDIELSRTYPPETCRRWCVLPFDRLSKSILVATTNPYNRQATTELEEISKHRLLWYLVAPSELVRFIKRIYR